MELDTSKCKMFEFMKNDKWMIFFADEVILREAIHNHCGNYEQFIGRFKSRYMGALHFDMISLKQKKGKAWVDTELGVNTKFGVAEMARKIANARAIEAYIDGYAVFKYGDFKCEHYNERK